MWLLIDLWPWKPVQQSHTYGEYLRQVHRNRSIMYEGIMLRKNLLTYNRQMDTGQTTSPRNASRRLLLASEADKYNCIISRTAAHCCTLLCTWGIIENNWIDADSYKILQIIQRSNSTACSAMAPGMFGTHTISTSHTPSCIGQSHSNDLFQTCNGNSRTA